MGLYPVLLLVFALMLTILTERADTALRNETKKSAYQNPSWKNKFSENRKSQNFLYYRDSGFLCFLMKMPLKGHFYM